jgi:hypothetical protein
LRNWLTFWMAWDMPNGVARLVLLPKSSDLSLFKKWRGLCLLDIAPKIFPSMCVKVAKIDARRRNGWQSGFRANRGTITLSYRPTQIQRTQIETDGSFCWPRESLCYCALRGAICSATALRILLPNHFVNIIIRLHKNAKIKVNTGLVDSELESSIGMQHGSCEDPVLHLFMI